MICEKCGEDIAVGAWPYCPHGAYRGTVIGDDIPGGQVIENLGHEPMVFYSKKAILKAADERGLQPMVRWAGPHDKHVSRWASVDLEAATALVSRMGQSSKDEEITCETATITVKVL